MTNPQQQFIANLCPAARKISEETGQSWELILAQAATETMAAGRPDCRTSPAGGRPRRRAT